MGNLVKDVNKYLNKMHGKQGVEKGSDGELAAFAICESIYQKYGGILYHSYTYKTDKDLKGNIKKADDGHLFVENLSATTEIDILLVTPYRIFPIEVKAYKSKKIVLTDEDIQGVFKKDKSPVHQNEMHCRHLYSQIYTVIPDGKTDYIVPIVVFVDECKLADKRSQWQKDYIKVTILNKLKDTINKYNTPLEYKIDLHAMSRKLTEVSTKYEKYLPYRDVEERGE